MPDDLSEYHIDPTKRASIDPGEKGTDEKFCFECGAVIRAKAETCPKCGVRQPGQPMAPTVSRNRTTAGGGYLAADVGDIWRRTPRETKLLIAAVFLGLWLVGLVISHLGQPAHEEQARQRAHDEQERQQAAAALNQRIQTANESIGLRLSSKVPGVTNAYFTNSETYPVFHVVVSSAVATDWVNQTKDARYYVLRMIGLIGADTLGVNEVHVIVTDGTGYTLNRGLYSKETDTVYW